jgi:hypothetical protein
VLLNTTSANATVLGFKTGQSVSVSRVPAFDDWGDFLLLLFNLIPDIPHNLINATYDPNQKLLLFNVAFGYQFDPVIPVLQFNETFKPLGEIDGSANLTFDARFNISTGLGVSFSHARGQNLTISGFIPTANGTVANYALISIPYFSYIFSFLYYF